MDLIVEKGNMRIETSRLIIRPFRASDWQDVLEYSSDPAVMHFIPMGSIG